MEVMRLADVYYRNDGARRRLIWARMGRLAKQSLPVPQSIHPYPDGHLDVMTRRRSPVRKSRTPGSVAVVPSNRDSYSDTRQ